MIWDKRAAAWEATHRHTGTSAGKAKPEDMISGKIVGSNHLESSNYIMGEEGWCIWGSGDVEFNNGYFRGDISAATGTFTSGIAIGTSPDWFKVDTSGNMWIGGATLATAPAVILNSGAATFSNVTVTGGSIAVSTLNGTLSFSNLDVAIRGWSQTCAFSVTDADTISWGAGLFTTADGTVYNIGAGNTVNMAAKTYIYLDTAVSPTAYQITTAAATAVGAGKVLVAIAQNAVGEATYSVLDGMGGQNIDAANIVAGTITANELATSITYAGAIIIDTAGNIRSGQTAYHTGTGWWLGDVTGTAKFSMGDPTANWLIWDGADLSSNKFGTISAGTFGGDGADGAFTITTGTTTLDVGAVQIYIKRYTSISITGDAKLAFTNPHARGTIAILKSQGVVVATSSTVPCIDLSAMGAAVGYNGTKILDSLTHYGGNGVYQGAGGSAGAILSNLGFYTKAEADLSSKCLFVACGSAGGTGSAGTNYNGFSAGGSAGAGGRGGGALIIECKGDLNFTGTVSVAGATGADGGIPSNYPACWAGNYCGGGGGAGGGGAAGMVAILYNTATSTAGTINTIGGAGGTGGLGGPGLGGSGGGGGGAYGGAGGAGSAATGAGSNAGGTSAAGGGGGGGGGGGSKTAGGAGGTAGASDDVLHAENVAFS